MNYFISFLVIIFIFKISKWLIEKSNFDNKVLNKLNNYKYSKFILGLMLIILGFLVEYSRQLLNEVLGVHNIPSIILKAILLGTYIKFFYLIFVKNKF